MVNRLKKPFQSQETAIASYDSTELASGTGYQTYFGGTLASGTDASGSVVLADNSFYSNTITSVGIFTNTITQTVDRDFDISFNLPKVARS